MADRRSSGSVLASILAPRPQLVQPPQSVEVPSEPTPAAKPSRGTPSKSTKPQPKRARYTTYIDRQLLERVVDAANHLRGHPHYLTVADIIEAGARLELARLEKDLNGGKPFAATRRRPASGKPAR